MIIGYARVSTTDQNPAIQIAALEAAGCERVFTDQKTGTKIEGRTALQEAIDFARDGDTITVTRIDRLARSIGDLQTIISQLKHKGIALRCTEQPVDTSTAAGKAFLDMLGVFAEFETNLRRERQLEGIAAAKVKGVYKGRKPSVDRAEVARRLAAGEGQSAIADTLGISRMTVHRIAKEIAEAAKVSAAA
ncbi:recombinase family protein [Tanticharoenia sakaeratensis]|uniref:DNA invertase gene rlgA n=1 Tax=Tanticharoenia sakaeratensis NBRC 103193 TaxID=1231623 RepID=A0A0D6MME7_9PROT|nr:recombinase family protein [Tanticharoenia sakaeratensis]GAN54837.1 DNA invertase gene rlgA [Tanticharoenia sakaeratensis NBRC 103193]GBQ21408.1 DNA resolvase [Tanticharoenia sakaeratensis NBRC 103193]